MKFMHFIFYQNLFMFLCFNAHFLNLHHIPFLPSTPILKPNMSLLCAQCPERLHL